MRATRLLQCALLAGAAVVMLSCDDPSPVGVPSRVSRPVGALVDSLLQAAGGGLLRCSPLPYDSVTQTIGPAGGTLVVGRNTLSIPAGALDTLVSITAVAPSDTVNRVQFQPQGLTFRQPASLTMSYANCTPIGAPKRVAYTSPGLQILQYLPSLDDASLQTVTGQLQHFSDYAVAW